MFKFLTTISKFQLFRFRFPFQFSVSAFRFLFPFHPFPLARLRLMIHLLSPYLHYDQWQWPMDDRFHSAALASSFFSILRSTKSWLWHGFKLSWLDDGWVSIASFSFSGLISESLLRASNLLCAKGFWNSPTGSTSLHASRHNFSTVWWAINSIAMSLHNWHMQQYAWS